MPGEQKTQVCVWGKEGEVVFKYLKDYVLKGKKNIFLKSYEDIEPAWNGKYFRQEESWNNMTMNIQKSCRKMN